MTNPNRFNPRNKGLSEANTKLILASLKATPRSITELMMVTGLSRQTIVKKLNQNTDTILSTDTHPKRYFLKGTEYKTVIDETVDKETARKPATRLDATKAAIVNDSPVVFFPTAKHNDLTIVHDNIMNSENPDPVQVGYLNAKSSKDLEIYEHKIKVMYDLIQFRKKLKGQFDE